MTATTTLPGARPYLLRQGEGLSHLVAGQVVRTLAGVEETAGGFGAVVADCPLDRGPIPMHWHEREHDTWFVTRGKLQVWANEQSRILSPGDFAYVQPGDTHSYRSVAPRTQFFGIVAPGGWEEFFVDAGEVWGMTALPPADRPFDFSRMGPAMGKHRIMRVDNPDYAEATAIGEVDQALPAGEASYFLEAGFGERRTLAGFLSTAVLTAAQSRSLIDMRTIEGGLGATLPPLRHTDTHLFLYLLDGVLSVTLDGEEHRLTSGDALNVPAGTAYGLRVASGAARWIATSAGGNGGSFWDEAGTPCPTFSHPVEQDGADRLAAISGIDVEHAWAMRTLSVGCLFSDRIEALLDGRVSVEGYDLQLHIREAQGLFRQVLREAAFDVAELSMGSHIASVAAGRREYLGLPVFLSRSFRHANLYVRTDRIAAPGDLRGARIGLADFQQTAALWVRGILADDHGVARESVDWVTGGLHKPVLDDRMAMALPAGIRLRRSPETLDHLLRTGEIDAIISPTAPRCFADPEVPVDRPWRDPRAEEERWWRARRLFPILHVAVLRRSLAEADPDLPGRLSAAFEEARRLAAADLAGRDFPKVVAPWLNAHAAKAWDVLDGDPWSYGLEANRATLETMLRYARADGLAPDALTPEDLFR